MNVSYNWLKEYVDLPLTPQEAADALTSIGLETGGVEEVESIRGGLRGLVIGKVLTCEEHPNSDHLHITTVDLGNGEPTQIVCGAPNVAAGQTVVVATVGATLYSGDESFQIKRSKIRGVESLGMICAEDEIGVGTSHDGIIVITDDVRPGTPAAEYFGLTSDYAIEVDLTPNRIDAASHYGVARDLAAWMRRNGIATTLRRPSVDAFRPDRSDGATPVEVLNPEACTRYAGLTIRNVAVKESPKWLKERLTAIGQRPINNIVDITNYILFAFCQPLHCFDLSKVKGGKIVVRTCPDGTPFTTLDGVERKLDARDLMICNAEEPMCIAGVFGGLDSGTTESSTDIFLEAACFNATSVRKTARRHGLSTDSSFRFERGVDPNNTIYALKAAALLVKELAGGEICGDIVDFYPEPVNPYPVTLSYDYINRLVGKEIEPEVVDDILDSLEIRIIARRDGEIDVEVPTYRVDVQRPCDIVEDILRIYGYNNVEVSSTVHSSLSYKGATDLAHNLCQTVSEQLTAAGFHEILNNSLTAERYYEGLTTFAPERCVRLINPLSADLSVMRQTLLFGALESVAYNINRRNADLMMYEFGNVYFANPEAESTSDAPLAPFSEKSNLAVLLTGNIRVGNWARPVEAATFFDLKAVVANVFARLGIDDKELRMSAITTDIYSQALSVDTRSGKHLGEIGIIDHKIARRVDVKQEVFFAELDWNALVKIASKKSITYYDLPRTHPVNRDLALLIDKEVTMEQVENVIRQSEKRLLRSVSLFDVYEGKKLPAGKKSYAVALVLQDEEKTLNDKQIEAVMNKIITNLTRQLDAQLR
ncbi:MAG: phenylalanine--tRNA ligase subunit beta [Muribaculaceae bacterium]|nr:phenylalanine--tRNA ligase subunit beta [Muribaculaceae bacterium]